MEAALAYARFLYDQRWRMRCCCRTSVSATASVRNCRTLNCMRRHRCTFTMRREWRPPRRLGISRVVLPRESTIEEIRSLSGQGMEIEVFVHGALCVCYSGQCLMSASLMGRSGNRGECAQPCRMRYELYREEMQGANKIPAQGAYR